MRVRVECPECGRRWSEEPLAQTVKCYGCGNVFDVADAEGRP